MAATIGGNAPMEDPVLTVMDRHMRLARRAMPPLPHGGASTGSIR
jgi:hypothetical protein